MNYVPYDVSILTDFLNTCKNSIGVAMPIGITILAMLTGFWLVVWVVKKFSK